MADGITVTHQVTAVKGSMNFDTGGLSFTATQTNGRFSAGVQDIGTTHEQVVIGSDIVAAGVSSFKNIDATNYVELGVVVSATFYPLVKLLPGESYPLRLATNTFYARANTAAVKLQFVVNDA